MAITIKLDGPLSSQEELWLAKNVGPRLHYIHNSVGGEGWIAKRQQSQSYSYEKPEWALTLEDERFATFFLLMFPQ